MSHFHANKSNFNFKIYFLIEIFEFLRWKTGKKGVDFWREKFKYFHNKKGNIWTNNEIF